jgi:Ca2+-binding RTX toxin-like protein
MSLQASTPEQRVNIATPGAEGTARVTALKDGGYLVVWQDGEPFGSIRCRTFDANGNIVGTERTLLAATETGGWRDPVLVTLPNGNVLFLCDGQENGLRRLGDGVLDSQGAPLRLIISGGTTPVESNGLDVEIDIDPTGAITRIFNDGEDIAHQRITIDGNVVGYGEVKRVGNSDIQETNGATATLANGIHAFVWQRGTEAIELRLSSNPNASPIVVSQGSESTVRDPDIVALYNDVYAVAWASDLNGEGKIHGKIIGDNYSLSFTLDAPGSTVGAPKLVRLSGGDFAVFWQSGDNVYGSVIDGMTGQAISSPFEISGAAGVQSEIEAAYLSDGRLVVTWTDTRDGAAEIYSRILSVSTIKGGEDTNVLNGSDALDDTIVGYGNPEGPGNEDVLSGLGGNDFLIGGDGADILHGGVGNDTLFGDNGFDRLFGGAGEDVFDGGDDFDVADYSNAEGELVIDLTDLSNNRGEAEGDSYSRIESWIGGSQGDRITADGQALELWGDGGGDIIRAGAGSTYLDGGFGDDTLEGGAGGDRMAGGAGLDIVSYESSNAAVTINLTGNGSASGGHADGDVFVSGAGDEANRVSVERVIGSAFADTLTGLATVGSYLDGGAGADTLHGGTGNDTFVVDSADIFGFDGDEISDEGGIDTLILKTEIFGLGDSLAVSIENLTAAEGAGNLSLRGNALANIITGNSGANIITGSGGADTLRGGGGNDTYFVHDVSDIVEEGTGDGTDTLNAYTSYSLQEDSEIEVLAAALDSNEAINLTGSSYTNTLKGNGRANRLDGGGGADVMQGFAGDDTYVVDHSGDQVLEDADGGSGTDAVETRVSFVLSANVEHLTAIGMASITLTGNSLANTMTGNAGANRLYGGSGDDRLIGGQGNDTLEGGSGSNTAVFSGSRAVSTITRNTDGTVTVKGPDGTDLLKDVRWLEFSDGAEFLNAAPTGLTLSNAVTVENAPLGAGVGQLSATDADGDTVRYSLAPGSSSAFGIRTVNGVSSLVVTGPLDFETQATHQVTIQARDDYGGVTSLTVNLTVTNNTLETTPFTIWGTARIDTLTGENGHDTIYGSSGNDQLYGALGNDLLHGGTGNDRLWGQGGKDVFVFDTRPNKSTNVDRVYDFRSADDSFYLDNKYFTKLGSGTLSRPKKFGSDMFTEGNKAQDAEDRIVYDKNTGNLYYDQDGTGSKAQVKIGTISNKTKLAYHDFFVI